MSRASARTLEAQHPGAIRLCPTGGGNRASAPYSTSRTSSRQFENQNALRLHASNNVQLSATYFVGIFVGKNNLRTDRARKS